MIVYVLSYYTSPHTIINMAVFNDFNKLIKYINTSESICNIKIKSDYNIDFFTKQFIECDFYFDDFIRIEKFTIK